MGDVLAGIHSSWEFDTDSVLIRFERGIRTPKLFQILGERRIPYEALSSVELVPGKRKGTTVLRAVPRPGADPLLDAAAGQLKSSADPYRLLLPAERETLAEYYADELRAALPATAAEPADGYLVAAPAAPLQFKAYDARVAFDGDVVSFRWFSTGASSAKWKAGDQFFQVSELAGIEWRSPRSPAATCACCAPAPTANRNPRRPSRTRTRRRCASAWATAWCTNPPLAAAVLAAVTSTEPARVPSKAHHHRADPADIADRIRHLGDLHGAGLLTDEEFSEKKKELLAEL